MPLGGYCEKCGKWVWVSAYGECQNGHPAADVRDIQLLTEQDGRRSVLRADRSAVVVPRRAKYRWWWRHSLWIVWTFTLGLLNWVAFFYIGIRARSVAWILSGLFYLLPLVLTIASIGTWWWRVAIPAQIVISGISVLHALAARPKYRAIMFGDLPHESLPGPPRPPPLMAGNGRLSLPEGIDVESGETLAQAHRRIRSILDAAGSIHKPDVRGQIARLCATAEEILGELAREPRQIPLARSFLAYYLEAAERIVAGYADLSCRSSSSSDVADSLTRAESSLDAVQRAFDRQLDSLLERRVIDLDVEVEVLEKTVGFVEPLRPDRPLEPAGRGAESDAASASALSEPLPSAEPLSPAEPEASEPPPSAEPPAAPRG